MGWRFPPEHMPGADTVDTRNTGSAQRDYRKLIRKGTAYTFMTGKKDTVHKSHCRDNRYVHDYMKEKETDYE